MLCCEGKTVLAVLPGFAGQTRFNGGIFVAASMRFSGVEEILRATARYVLVRMRERCQKS
jgi:hypothetical protein